ncbi:hypothetical protein ACIQW9_02290 [Herminiimonas sp. NPDC097707]|uniref:hypothetical protein n=1 Tax=Herminiimonas sp. NPDC097707 TaxID=3364007 RepID=UPI00383BA63D
MTNDERVRIGITDNTGSILGLSFGSPDETGWTITKSGLSAKLKRDGESADENQEIEAYVIKLDTPFNPISGYIEHLKKNIQEAFVKNQEFSLQTLDVKEYPQNNQCVRVHLLLEYLRNIRTYNKQQKRWSEQHIISCGSTKYKRMGFEVRYYQRYYDQNKDDQSSVKADKLFESVIIEDK